MVRTSLSEKKLQKALGRVRRRQARVTERYPGDSRARQPVHTVYGGAHLFVSDTAGKLGQLALRTLEAYAADAGAFAEAISGHALPYAVLMYIWGAKVLPESTTVSALTSRIRMIAVSSDEEGAGRWQSYRRNIAEDYRRVFGEEPGRVTAIELMTDTDNTGAVAETFYGDLSLSPAP